MDLQSRKISFIQEFLRIQNEEIISGLEAFLKKKTKNNLYPLSESQFNSEIDLAIKDAENGKTISAEDLKEKIKKWS